MDERPRDLSETLRRNGLEGPAFDVAALAEDLAGWWSTGQELERLLEDQAIGDPTAFHPDWE